MSELGNYQHLGGWDRSETMTEQGRSRYDLDYLIDRLFGDSYSSSDEILNNRRNWWNAFQPITAQEMFDDAERVNRRFYERLIGDVETTNEEFYSMLGGMAIDDSGYLEATTDELTKMTAGVSQASKLLDVEGKPIRSLGDLHSSYKKSKKRRQMAASRMDVNELTGGTTISFRDPITGEVVTHNRGQVTAASAMGVMNVDAWQEAFEGVQSRVDTRQQQYDSWAVDADRLNTLLDDNEQTDSDTWQTFWIRPGCFPTENNPTGCRIYDRDQAYTELEHYEARSIRHQAFNELVGGNDATLAFLQSGSGFSQSYRQGIYGGLADIISSTYGNLYSASFDTLGATLLSAELTGKSVDEATTMYEEQKFKTTEHQKALRESLKGLDLAFNKAKRKFGKKDKDAKAMFGGFRKDVPQ